MTGQHYLRARYYNPVVGRFLQEDVYRGDGLNLYAYCANNPVVYYDPNGYDCKEETQEQADDYLTDRQDSGHHNMYAAVERDGDYIGGKGYESGGGRPGYGLEQHTERRFLEAYESGDLSYNNQPIIPQANDHLYMIGETPPCRPGCQPAIREAVKTHNISATYEVSKNGKTVETYEFMTRDMYNTNNQLSPNLKGDVIQIRRDGAGNIVEQRRYWTTSSGKNKSKAL